MDVQQFCEDSFDHAVRSFDEGVGLWQTRNRPAGFDGRVHVLQHGDVRPTELSSLVGLDVLRQLVVRCLNHGKKLLHDWCNGANEFVLHLITPHVAAEVVDDHEDVPVHLPVHHAWSIDVVDEVDRQRVERLLRHE